MSLFSENWRPENAFIYSLYIYIYLYIVISYIYIYIYIYTIFNVAGIFIHKSIFTSAILTQAIFLKALVQSVERAFKSQFVHTVKPHGKMDASLARKAYGMVS